MDTYAGDPGGEFHATPVSEEERLRREVRQLRELVNTLQERLHAAQIANERMYAAEASAHGGSRFDPEQPLGTEPRRTLGTLFLKGRS